MRRGRVRPWRTVPAVTRYGVGLGLTGAHLATRALGHPLPEVVHPDPRDARFRDPTWTDNILYHGGLELYLLTARLLHELVGAADLEGPRAPKAEFAASLARPTRSSPTNFLLGNPRALKRAFETGGTSVVRGLRNFVHDMVKNDGWPSQVDRSSFVLGRNTAATPGQVVFRNELIEVLQYEPTTDEVFERPLRGDPAVDQPLLHRRPRAGEEPGGVGRRPRPHHVRGELPQPRRVDPRPHVRRLPAPRAAHRHRRRARDHRQRDGQHAVDLPRRHDDRDVPRVPRRVRRRARALVDLPQLRGRLRGRRARRAAVFADPATLESLSRRMERHGYLPGKDIARTFDLLRANDLVFRYVVDSWLLGEKPPAFDLLAWNADSTNLPGKAHGEFLRKAYLENALAHDEYTALGERLMISEIGTDSYIVAGIDDHIVPWQVVVPHHAAVQGTRCAS